MLIVSDQRNNTFCGRMIDGLQMSNSQPRNPLDQYQLQGRNKRTNLVKFERGGLFESHAERGELALGKSRAHLIEKPFGYGQHSRKNFRFVRNDRKRQCSKLIHKPACCRCELLRIGSQPEQVNRIWGCSKCSINTADQLLQSGKQLLASRLEWLGRLSLWQPTQRGCEVRAGIPDRCNFCDTARTGELSLFFSDNSFDLCMRPHS